MTTEETIAVGIAFAERAVKNDKNARKRDNHSLFQNAITDYTRAIEMFSLASTFEHSVTAKQLLQNKMVMCRDRKVILQDYLTTTRAMPSSARKTEPLRVKRLNEQGPTGCGDLHSLFARLNVSTVDHNALPALKDVMGLENAKKVLEEATMLPEQFPDLFEARRTWRTILLYGPAGVGKAFIAKAIAGESKSRFFSLTAGDLMAGCVNACERTVKDLFAAVRKVGKVVFYFDDVDVMFSTEHTEESEKLRRVKGQFLKEVQGLEECGDEVVLIASSRSPWVLEEALLRRMDKRVHVGLPNAKSRTEMLEELLRKVSHRLRREDIENIATECETYSGSDMKVLVMDAEMEPLRVIQDSSHFRHVWVERKGEIVELLSPCSADDDGAVEMKYTEIERNMLHIAAVTCLDFELALDRTRPTVGLDTVEKHMAFTRRKGEHG